MNKLWKFTISRWVHLAAFMVLVMIILIVLPGLAQAEAGYLFATPTGSGSNCTQAAPCQLATAVNKALDTEIVYPNGPIG